MRLAGQFTTVTSLLVVVPAASINLTAADLQLKSEDSDWFRGITTEGDVDCKVEHDCVVGSGLGTCVVKVDPMKAKPMGSTDKGYAVDFVDNNIVEKNRVARFSAPASDVTISGHSHSAHWNLCWSTGSGSRMPAESVQDFCYWVNGLCFLWSSPCSGGCSQLRSFSTYSSFCPGLRYATEAEWSAALPTLDGSDAFHSKCAASQLDPLWKHCDKGNTLARVEDNGYNDLVLVCGSATHPTELLKGVGTAPKAAGSTGGGSAVGDPHMQNIHGERFDLMRPGKHVLINIPRGMSAENVLLRVDASAHRLGGACADMYFQQLNISGAWVDSVAGHAGGVHFEAHGLRDEHPKWTKFGKVEIKVAHGRTHQGILYLNFYVKHLGSTGLAVGGLLGEDDHAEAAKPMESCNHQLSLIEDHEGTDNDDAKKGRGSSRLSSFFKNIFKKRHGESEVSVAEASLA